MKNISELKHYKNFQASGLSVLDSFIIELLNCEANFNHQPIDDFQQLMGIDLLSNAKRYYYPIDSDRIVLSIKVFNSETKEIMALMPITLKGKNIICHKSQIFEQLAATISIQMSKCYNSSFHEGTLLFGENLEKMVISRSFALGVYDMARFSYLISYIEHLADTTFEGENFTTGFILTRSLYDYEKGKCKSRYGTLHRLSCSHLLVRNP